MTRLELPLAIAIVMSIFIGTGDFYVFAQFPSSTSSIPASSYAGGNGTSVSVSSNVGMEISNETLKGKEGMLRSAVLNFLNSGPNVIKATPTDQPNVKTKITNQINNVTQNVEGVEATNAIVGVEISKALKTVITSPESNNSAFVSVGTSSSCVPEDAQAIKCENTVTIK